MARTTHEAVLFLEQATAHNTNFLSVSRQDLNLEAHFFSNCIMSKSGNDLKICVSADYEKSSTLVNACSKCTYTSTTFSVFPIEFL